MPPKKIQNPDLAKNRWPSREVRFWTLKIGCPAFSTRFQVLVKITSSKKKSTTKTKLRNFLHHYIALKFSEESIFRILGAIWQVLELQFSRVVKNKVFSGKNHVFSKSSNFLKIKYFLLKFSRSSRTDLKRTNLMSFC